MVLTLAALFLTGRCPPNLGSQSSGESFSLNPCGLPSWAQGAESLTSPLSAASTPGLSAQILAQSGLV